MTMIVSVCYDDGPAEKLMIASSSSSSELTNVLCERFSREGREVQPNRPLFEQSE